MDQKVFETVYRGRQSVLHHMAYMRMSKVLLTLRILELAGVRLPGKTIFDYGFGAGTFFRYCPRDARVFGVEMDPAAVREAERMARARGVAADLQAIDVDNWRDHPLLKRTYDVFLCSHVLEHLDDPAAFLAAVRPCVATGGVFVGLVPINEREANPHHVHSPDKKLIAQWLKDAGFDLLCYEENDPFIYYLQGYFTVDAGVSHTIARVISLGLGIPATLIGQRAWFAFGRLFAALTGSQPTQAAFVCRPNLSVRAT